MLPTQGVSGVTFDASIGFNHEGKKKQKNTDYTLNATLKAHKYSNVRQQKQQHLCVYKTGRSPVGVSLLRWNMKRDRQ